MVTSHTVFGESSSRMIGVHFTTSVRHKAGDSTEIILLRAKDKMMTFLRRYNPSVVSQLDTFVTE